MPIFHFNLNDHKRDEDPEGTELRDFDEARAQAIVFAGAYLSDNPGLVWDGTPFAVEVTEGDSEEILFTVTIEVSKT